MATVIGKLTTTSPGFFVATFSIDNVDYEYSAKFIPALPVIPSEDVALTYATKSQLMETLAFSGEVVDGMLNLRFSSPGVIMAGRVDGMERNHDGQLQIIHGTGSWNTSAPVSATAYGTITSTSSATFVAVFTVNECRHKYSGSFDPPMTTFSSNMVTLTFDNEGQIMGQSAFSAQVGISSLSIIFSSPGVTVAGELDKALSSKHTIAGTGTWGYNTTPSARGTIATSSDTQFIAEFDLNDVKHTYGGTFSPRLRFSCNDATLTFENDGQLLGTPAFSADIGIDRIHFNLGSGVVIRGILDENLSQKTTITGTGRWGDVPTPADLPAEKRWKVEEKYSILMTRTWME